MLQQFHLLEVLGQESDHLEAKLHAMEEFEQVSKSHLLAISLEGSLLNQDRAESILSDLIQNDWLEMFSDLDHGLEQVNLRMQVSMEAQTGRHSL